MTRYFNIFVSQRPMFQVILLVMFFRNLCFGKIQDEPFAIIK